MDKSIIGLTSPDLPGPAVPGYRLGLAWRKEVERRLASLDSGEVVCIPWEQVRQRLRDEANRAHARS